MENKNKFLAIAITILVLAGLLAGAYFFLYKKSATTDGTDVSSQAILTKVSDDAVISPIAIPDGSAVWYFNAKGQLFRRATASGVLEEYSLPSLIANFKKAYWSVSGENIILDSSSANGEVLNFFDTKAGAYKLLPANIRALDWMPDNQRIIYIWKSGDNKHQQLVLANADASGFTPIADVFWSDFTVKASPDGKNVLLWRTPAQDSNKIYKANIATGEFTTVVDAGKNLEAKWVSPTKFVYVQAQNNQNQVKLYDLDSGQSEDLGVSAVLDKVAVDTAGKYLYADVMDNVDIIWKIDLETLDKQKVYEFDSSITPSGLFVNGQKIFFVNAFDNKLYNISQ